MNQSLYIVFIMHMYLFIQHSLYFVCRFAAIDVFFFNNHRLFNENASLNLEIIVHIIFGRYGQLENYFHNWNRIVSELSIVHTVYLIISLVAKMVQEQYLKNCPAPSSFWNGASVSITTKYTDSPYNHGAFLFLWKIDWSI